MESNVALEYQWPYLLSFLPPEEFLEASARDCGALKRKRAISKASDLLRLALAYSLCDMSLRQTAAWASVAGVASMSDVALMKRLRKADVWLGKLLGIKLAERAPLPRLSCEPPRVRLVDATNVSKPGSTGTDWRIHLGYDLSSFAIDHIELTDAKGGEKLGRFRFRQGELVVGDRGYAHRKGLAIALKTGADFIVRLNWQNLPLRTPSGESFDIITALRGLPEAETGGFLVRIAPSKDTENNALPARLVATRKTEEAAEAARAKVLRERSRKGRSVDPRTLEAAGYVFVLTSLSAEQMSGTDVLNLYRFRWQIELAFKRMKSLMRLGALPVRDPPLARTFLYSKLLAALLIEEFTSEFLAISPWGYRLANETTVALEDSEGAV